MFYLHLNVFFSMQLLQHRLSAYDIVRATNYIRNKNELTGYCEHAYSFEKMYKYLYIHNGKYFIFHTV